MTKKNLSFVSTEEELQEVISTIKEEENPILLKNCSSKLTVGNREVKTNYDTIIDSDKNLYLFLGDMKEQLEELLEQKQIPIHTIYFKKDQKQEFEKDIHFINGRRDLELYLRERYVIGKDTCTYYPKMKGQLELQYQTDDEIYPFEERKILGAIEFPKDLVLFLVQKKESLTLSREVFLTLWDHDIETEVEWIEEFPRLVKPRQYQKGEKNGRRI